MGVGLNISQTSSSFNEELEQEYMILSDSGE